MRLANQDTPATVRDGSAVPSCEVVRIATVKWISVVWLRDCWDRVPLSLPNERGTSYRVASPGDPRLRSVTEGRSPDRPIPLAGFNSTNNFMVSPSTCRASKNNTDGRTRLFVLGNGAQPISTHLVRIAILSSDDFALPRPFTRLR